MGTELAKVGQTRSLPPRLAVLASALGTVEHPGQPVRHNLPEGWTITAAERKAAEITLESLTRDLDATAPFGRSDAATAKASIISKIVLGLAGASQESEVVSSAKVEMYADAIEDLPAWAVEAARLRWVRGQCPYTIEESPRYAFPPAPATLRKMALFDLEDLRRDERKLKNLLAAVPLERAMNPEPLPSTAAMPALRRM